MKRTILTTVGTSLLTNADDRPWRGWKHKQPLPAAEEVDRWLWGADGIRASAETHTWQRLGLFDDAHGARVEVVLIHSQTPDGAFCAARLENLAKRRDISARCREVQGLSYTEGKTFARGLRQLARVVGDEIRRGRQGGTVELAATGGFKAEIAVANLVGAVSRTPVHYIYQEFSSIVTIDPIPVALSAEWVGGGPCQALLHQLASARDVVELTAVESLLKQDERLWMLLEVEDGLAAPSLLGEIARSLIDVPQEPWPPASEAAPESKIHLQSAAHHRPSGWKEIVQTLARCRYVTAIRYEGAAAGRELKESHDNDSDLIHRIEQDGSPALNLRIATTARNAEQRRLVRDLLRKELRLK